MIYFALFLSFVCLASSSAILPYGVSAYDAPVYEKPQPYGFAFDVKDDYGTTLIRQEQGDELGNKKGTYGYIDAYGISRQVDYVADDKGFRAVVKTNEPGTDNQNPADVEIISSAIPSQAYGNGPVTSYGRPSLSAVYGQQGPAVSGISSIGKQSLRPVGSIPSSVGLVPSAYGPVQPSGPLY